MNLLKRFTKVNPEDYFKINGLMPEHIAIMMDGNGIWATRRGLPRTSGHYAGMMTMREIIRKSHRIHI